MLQTVYDMQLGIYALLLDRSTSEVGVIVDKMYDANYDSSMKRLIDSFPSVTPSAFLKKMEGDELRKGLDFLAGFFDGV